MTEARKQAIQEVEKEQNVTGAEKVFDYLDDLRDSGVTNMFGSPAYVEFTFGLVGHELVFITEQKYEDDYENVRNSLSKRLVAAWMSSFGK